MDSARRGLLINKRMWLTKEGDLIKVIKMSNQHLVNTLRCLKRQWTSSLEELLMLSSPPQGEMALLEWERELDGMEFMEFEDDEGIQVLLKETIKRKLNWELFDETMEYFQCRSGAITSTGQHHSSFGVQMKNLMNLMRSRS